MRDSGKVPRRDEVLKGCNGDLTGVVNPGDSDLVLRKKKVFLQFLVESVDPS